MKLKPQITACLTLVLALTLVPLTSRARYLNPTTGRFQTMDSYEGNNADPLSLHKYLYCQATPVNRIDPSGLFSFTQLLVGMAVAGTINAIFTPYTANAPAPGDATYPAVTGDEIVANFAVGAVTYGAGRGVGWGVGTTTRGVRGFVARRIASNRATANFRTITIGELLPDVDDSAMLHLSAATEVELRVGVDVKSYWVRKGDVAHLTVAEYKYEVVGPAAAGYSTEASIFVIREAEPGLFVVNPREVGLAGVVEYSNLVKVVPDDMLIVPPIAPAPRPSTPMPGPGVSSP